jgi:hypothetical protein
VGEFSATLDRIRHGHQQSPGKSPDLAAAFESFSAARESIKYGSKQSRDESLEKTADIDKAKKRIEVEVQKLEEILTKIEQLLPKMRVALGDESKEPCDPTPHLIAVRSAELARFVAGIERAVESSIHPLPPDLEQLVKKFRPVLRAVPALFRHSVPH